MKAVVFRKDRGLVYEEVPDYQVAPDEVLVKVANTGFCGSDHSLVAGGLLPDGYILGHEISGVVVDKGAEAGGAARGHEGLYSSHLLRASAPTASPANSISAACTVEPRESATCPADLPSISKSIRRC
ncbi:MAG: alcohol dehydrogenase catalytic domain-containing protein [Desulfobacterales bacterium]|nr:alcohol dehydrogenase catalytic domain-containing protein [Desulfobacterales bacterium]